MKKKKINAKFKITCLIIGFFLLLKIIVFLLLKTQLINSSKVTSINIVDWAIALFSGTIPIWLFYESKEETKKIEDRLEKEIIARKDSEIENIERSKSLFEMLHKYAEEDKKTYYQQNEKFKNKN